MLCCSQVCLQVFQLLPRQVALLVYSKDSVNMSVREILEFLMSIILGEVCVCGRNYIFGKTKVSVSSHLILCHLMVSLRCPAETRGCWQALRLQCYSARCQTVSVQDQLPGVCCKSPTQVRCSLF